MSKTLGDIHGLAIADIPNLTQIRDTQRAVNRVIREINSKWSGILATEKSMIVAVDLSLTFDSGGKTITFADDSWITRGITSAYKVIISGPTESENQAELTINTVAELVLTVDEDLADEGPVTCTCYFYLSDYSYSITDRQLTFPAGLKELRTVFVNAAELENRPFEYVKSANYADEPVYAVTDRDKIIFPTGLLVTDEDYVHVTILEDIDEISTATPATEIDIPKQLENTLIDGAKYYLLAISKYRSDDTLFAVNQKAYEADMVAVEGLEIRRLPSANRTMAFKY